MNWKEALHYICTDLYLLLIASHNILSCKVRFKKFLQKTLKNSLLPSATTTTTTKKKLKRRRILNDY